VGIEARYDILNLVVGLSALNSRDFAGTDYPARNVTYHASRDLMLGHESCILWIVLFFYSKIERITTQLFVLLAAYLSTFHQFLLHWRLHLSAKPQGHRQAPWPFLRRSKNAIPPSISVTKSIFSVRGARDAGYIRDPTGRPPWTIEVAGRSFFLTVPRCA
jgi:hypothetical protein